MKLTGSKLNIRLLTFAMFLMGTVLISCGDDETQRIPRPATFSGQDSFKLDVLLALDDSPSASFTNPAAMTQGVQNFVNRLVSENPKWDIRVLVMALGNPSRRSKIWAGKLPVRSKQRISSSYLIDGNRDGKSEISEISSLTNFYYIDPYAKLGEPGISNIESLLWGYARSANFHREDAQLAVVVFTNGVDTSDGINPTTQFPYSSVSQSHINSLSNLKERQEHVRYYAVVSPAWYTSAQCNGSNAHPDQRYSHLATEFNGATLNICAQGSFQSAMSAVASRVELVKLSVFNRVSTNCRPPGVDLDSYEVTIVKNGQFTVPKDPVECRDQDYADSHSGCIGWVYEGYRTDNPPARLSPDEGDYLPAGHIIRFNGPSRFYTGDEINVSC